VDFYLFAPMETGMNILQNSYTIYNFTVCGFWSAKFICYDVARLSVVAAAETIASAVPERWLRPVNI